MYKIYLNIRKKFIYCNILVYLYNVDKLQIVHKKISMFIYCNPLVIYHLLILHNNGRDELFLLFL